MTGSTKMKTGYINHLRYTKVKQLISKKQCTAEDLLKKTSIPIATMYRILQSLLENNEIDFITTTSSVCGLPPRIYKLNRGKQT